MGISKTENAVLTHDLYPEQVLKQWLNLDDGEVWIQHCHSLSDQQIQFPLSTSPCDRRLSILRDVFAIVEDRDAGKHRYPKIISTRLLFDWDTDKLWDASSGMGGVRDHEKKLESVSQLIQSLVTF